MENYFTYATLYEYVLETSGEPTGKNYDSSNVADFETELKDDEDFKNEINPLVICNDPNP